ncbi:hypothetical protein GRI62_11815 [Erythrobacter arachoides]|uniref:Lipoprotein n=1 Tax=Aurantiacibacter arachoides TaxID=1850444 RepID=A0A845A4C8_9SPHN|nr:hypothetical protein [Aurantiacibacter arachoides]MXO94282.1 hypothetical protein [Aurantiacibacter arachoides]GGD64703.1 hypothetical protein GCM10011411_26260 [Aurantiacibacter arachoides]
MKMIFRAALAAMVLTGCDAAAPNVYEMPIPSSDDSAAMIEIRDGLEPDDRGTWSELMMANVNPLSKGIRSATVGEAIEKYRARKDCMASNSLEGIDITTEMERYNATVAAYNACLEMPY